jgi:hypothetical protein
LETKHNQRGRSIEERWSVRQEKAPEILRGVVKKLRKTKP